MARSDVSHWHAPSGEAVAAQHPDMQIGGYLEMALVLICLLVGGFGGWAAVASINGAVVAQATLAAQTRTNTVQHLEGGVVSEIKVHEGDNVTAGQVLVRLDAKEADQELKGLTAELAAKNKQIELFNSELNALQDLASRGLVPRVRVTTMQRDIAGLEGEIGRLSAQKAVAEARMKRLEVRAPLSGRVLNLALHTVGGVIAPGKELMQIVPTGDTLVLEAKLQPKDIDQIHPGQHVVIRLSALNQRTTPQLSGSVVVVSPDVIKDDAHGTQYFTTRIAFNEGETAKLRGVELVPGMPAEVMIQTEARSALSYLIKPLHDQVVRAFREE